MNCRRKLGEAISGVVLLSAGWAVVGCGGTNPNDSTNPYNRSGNYQNNLSPGSTDGRSPSPNEVVSVAAVVIAEQDSKRIDALFQGFKKLGNPPKRVFLMGSTLKSVERWIAPAKAAKIDLVPLPGQVNATEWKSIIVKCGKTKLFGNGPSLNKPNVDGVTSDQSMLTSSFALEDTRYVVLNTDTPMQKADKKLGAIPGQWLNQQLALSQKSGSVKNVVVFGGRPLAAGADGFSNSKDLPIYDRFVDSLVRNSKVRSYVHLGGASGMATRLKESGPYLISVQSERVGFLQSLKNGALKLVVQVVGDDPTKTWTDVETVTLFEPSVAQADQKRNDTRSGPKNGAKKSTEDSNSPDADNQPDPPKPPPVIKKG